MTPKTKLVALLLTLCAASALGQDDAAPPARPPAPEAEREPPEAPPTAQRPEVDDDEFIPTEELNPDAAVTFPVDI